MSKKQLTVVKIGGNIIDDSAKLHAFLLDFVAIKGAKILVHGGGKVASEVGLSMGVEPNMLAGRRVTDIETLRIVTMVYAGLINKNMVAQLQAKGCNAIGLTGADANLIAASKRAIIPNPTHENPNETIDYGYVGDLSEKSINASGLQYLLEGNLVPVFSAITHDGASQLLNTNADTIAAALAVRLSQYYTTQLVYCFEKRGVLKDVKDDNSLISTLNKKDFDRCLSEGIIADGMIPKLQNAFLALNSGVENVFIGDANELSGINSGIFGTKITH